MQRIVSSGLRTLRASNVCVSVANATLQCGSNQRFMSHNPQWIREETKKLSEFNDLYSRVMNLEEGALQRKKPISVLRRERIYGTANNVNKVIRPMLPPVAPAIESWMVNLRNERVGIVGLDPQHFNAPIRKDIVQRVVQWQLAKRRQGTHKTKDRTEVSGTTRKPHPQKGTGRARASCLRSPLHYHGGRANPRLPRDYSYPLPKAIRRKGLQIALTDKRKSNRLVIVDAATMETHKTRELERLLSAFDYQGQNGNRRALFIYGNYELDPNFALAVRNLASVTAMPAMGANVYDILVAHTVFITAQGLADLQERLDYNPRRVKFVAPRTKLLPYRVFPNDEEGESDESSSSSSTSEESSDK